MNSTQDFIERMGLLTERAGLTRIAGRLLAFLLLDGQAFALDDLAARLRVSKASISTNARLLEKRGFITRLTRPGDRRDFYRVIDEPWEQMFALINEQLRETKSLFDAACATLPFEDEAARHRLAAWAAFHTFLLEDSAAKLARWRERRSA